MITTTSSAATTTTPPLLTPACLHFHAKLTRPAPPAGSGTTSVNPDSAKWNQWPSYCTMAHTDAFDRQLIRIHTQCSPQSKVIMSVGNWPADSDMIPAPVVTCLNNEITIKWQTCAPPALHPRRHKAPLHRQCKKKVISACGADVVAWSLGFPSVLCLLALCP